MIIVLSNTADATADFLCARLDKDTVTYVRLDTDRLTATSRFMMRATTVTLQHGKHNFSPKEVSCVLLRRPRPIIVSAADEDEGAYTSAEWAETLEGFLACVPANRWINHPTNSENASHKLEQLGRASRLGFSVPETLLTQDKEKALAFLEQHAEVVAKPLSGGFVERTSGKDSLIYTTRVLPEHRSHLDLLDHCPTLFQAEIERSVDVRVTAVDGRFTAVALRKSDNDGRQMTDIRRDNWEGVSYERISLPRQTQQLLATMLTEYGLRFAAVDFVVSRTGQWFFLEINTGGQWAWLDMHAGTDIAGDLLWAMTQTQAS